MIAEDQSSTIDFLKHPSAYAIAHPVEQMETHISLIFLAGERAYKLKRAVKLPYADFSTAVLRLAACEKEVALNVKTAPDLYLGVRRITRGVDGRMALDGEGETVDAVVEMKRFDQEHLLDCMAVAGKLTPALMCELAAEIARFHRDAPIVHSQSGSANMRGVLDINEAGFATSHVFSIEEIAAFNAEFRSTLEHHGGLLDRREKAGKVRRCHGDLHLRNICLLDGRPQLFDCIEFNDEIATVDVLYDLAFLLMDLWHRGLRGFASLVMNRYLDQTGDENDFNLIPFLMAVRAAVRAHVIATQAQENGQTSGDLADLARSYFDLAVALLKPATPRLIAIGGLSGSGKTTIAEAVAPLIGAPPGARVVESDRIRKAMFGVAPETRLGAEAYRPEISQKVYSTLCTRSGRLLVAGGTVVVDAVFDKLESRVQVEEAARRSAAPFLGIWLEADPVILRKRVADRRGGASDATGPVLEDQLRRDVGDMRWKRVPAGDFVNAVVRAVLG